MLYRFVDAQKAEGFPVRMMCLVVGVSPSAYYAHKQRPRSGPAGMAEAALVDEIRTIWADSDGTYGSPRVCAALRRQGLVVNHKRVERLMKCHRMVGFVPRKRRVTITPPFLRAAPRPRIPTSRPHVFTHVPVVSATTNLARHRSSGGWVVSGRRRFENMWWWQLVESVFDEVASAASPGLVCVGELPSGE